VRNDKLIITINFNFLLSLQKTLFEMDKKFEELINFYKEVDNLTSKLNERHKTRLKCKAGCFFCCVDNITVFEVEAEFIKKNNVELLKSELPHPQGFCAFLNNKGECRIYEHRPYVCRTQGLPLRWLEEINEEELIDMRDICPLNEEGEPIVNLKIEDCWTIGPFEEKLAEIQSNYEKQTTTENKMTRIELRKLFDAI